MSYLTLLLVAVTALWTTQVDAERRDPFSVQLQSSGTVLAAADSVVSSTSLPSQGRKLLTDPFEAVESFVGDLINGGNSTNSADDQLSDTWEEWYTWAIIAAVVVGLALLVLLICCCCPCCTISALCCCCR